MMILLTHQRKDILLIVFLYFSLFYNHSLWGQSDCPILPASQIIHANQVRAFAVQQGILLFDYLNADQGYFLPYTGPESPSGYVAGSVYVTGFSESGILRGSGNDIFTLDQRHYFLPGPLAAERAPECEETQKWNKVFTVSGQAILQHIQDAQDGRIDHPLDEVFGWPAKGNIHFESIHGMELKLGPQGGAHFIESPSHKNGLYEPQFGEYPHVLNLSVDQTPGQITWHVYNNAKSQEFYRNFNSVDKMVCEIQECHYSFSCPGTHNDQTLFQQFKIVNAGKTSINKLTFSLVLNPDLGCYADDYIGTSPSQNTMYTYNADSLNIIPDQACQLSPKHIGVKTAQTMTFLNWPMNSSSYFHNYSSSLPNKNITNPSSLASHRNYALGKWKNGIPITRGGNGYNESSSDSTKFVFTDSPNLVGGWSMRTEKLDHHYDNYRSISSIFIEKLSPEENIVLDVAYAFESDSNLNDWDIVNKALINSERIQNEYSKGIQRCNLLGRDCQDVWPGDANSDGLVNYLDFIPVFLSHGKTGPQRNNPFPFVPQHAIDWKSSSSPGINTKYADTDGNGVINDNDIEMVESYLGLTNYCHVNRPINCEIGDDVFIEFSTSDTIQDSPNRGGVFLKNSENIAGFSCILYTNSDVISLFINESVDWLDATLSARSRILSLNRSRNEIGISVMASNNKNNSLKSNSNNELIHLKAKYMGISSYPTDHIRLSICDFTLYYEDGSSKKLPTMHKDLYLPDDVVITSTSSIDQNAPTLFPNPSEGFLHVHSEKTYNFALFDQHGIQIKKGIVAKGVSELDFSNVVKGFYLIKFWQENLSYMQKVIIQK